MTDAKKRVNAMIERRRRNNTRNRNNKAKKLGPDRIVLDFFKAMEASLQEVKSAIAFDHNLDEQATKLLNNLKAIDPGVNVELKWNDEVNVEDWRKLYVEGVMIKWSSFYLGQNPLAAPTKYVDATYLLLNGYLDDD